MGYKLRSMNKDMDMRHNNFLKSAAWGHNDMTLEYVYKTIIRVHKYIGIVMFFAS